MLFLAAFKAGRLFSLAYELWSMAVHISCTTNQGPLAVNGPMILLNEAHI